MWDFNLSCIIDKADHSPIFICILSAFVVIPPSSVALKSCTKVLLQSVSAPSGLYSEGELHVISHTYCIRSHKYTLGRPERSRMPIGLHSNTRCSFLCSRCTLHCTRVHPITSCHPAQQTTQCHEDIYGISHPALFCLIPLSDSFLNGINKLSRSVSGLHFSSQRNKNSACIYEGIQVRRLDLSEAFYEQ